MKQGTEKTIQQRLTPTKKEQLKFQNATVKAQENAALNDLKIRARFEALSKATFIGNSDNRTVESVLKNAEKLYIWLLKK